MCLLVCRTNIFILYLLDSFPGIQKSVINHALYLFVQPIEVDLWGWVFAMLKVQVSSPGLVEIALAILLNFTNCERKVVYRWYRWPPRQIRKQSGKAERPEAHLAHFVFFNIVVFFNVAFYLLQVCLCLVLYHVGKRVSTGPGAETEAERAEEEAGWGFKEKIRQLSTPVEFFSLWCIYIYIYTYKAIWWIIVVALPLSKRNRSVLYPLS